jgi:hypothetical protein
MSGNDPVQHDDRGWWFRDIGPYEDESAARQAQEHADIAESERLMLAELKAALSRAR